MIGMAEEEREREGYKKCCHLYLIHSDTHSLSVCLNENIP